jgi:hypothetical protein
MVNHKVRTTEVLRENQDNLLAVSMDHIPDLIKEGYREGELLHIPSETIEETGEEIPFKGYWTLKGVV